MMKFFNWISLAVFGAAAANAGSTEDKVAPTELQIETTFMPESCPNKAQSGDRIQVHYVSDINVNPLKEHFNLKILLLDRYLVLQRKQIRFKVRLCA